MSTLIDRIDTALAEIGRTRAQLADGIGLSTQAISNLKRRPGSSLKPESLARAARWLKCDWFWLLTGEGGKYVPDGEEDCSPLTKTICEWLDSLDEATYSRAFLLFCEMRAGHWPAPATKRPPGNGKPKVDPHKG